MDEQRTAPRETFGAMTARLRTRAFLSQNKLARRAGCDPAYVNRIELGTQPSAGRAVVLNLAAALDLSERETDRYLFAAGLAPERDYQALYEASAATLTTIREALEPPDVGPLPFVRRAVG